MMRLKRRAAIADRIRLRARALAGVACLFLQGAHAAQMYPLGGSGNWKYMVFDAATKSVFLAHGSEVTVFDTVSMRVSGRVTGFHGAHGIALVPGGEGYAASSKDATLHVFDTRTFRTTAIIPVGEDANSVTYDPASRRVFVGNDDSGTISVIDTATNKVVATISLPGGEGIESAEADGRGHLFVNHSAGHEIVRIDTQKSVVDAHWALQDCAKPQGLALDKDGGRLFVSCENGRLLVLSQADGRLLGTAPIAPGGDTVLFDAQRRVIYAPGTDGTMSVIGVLGPDRYVASASITTGAGARTAALDPLTGRVYLVVADQDTGPPARNAGDKSRVRLKAGTARLLVFAR